MRKIAEVIDQLQIDGYAVTVRMMNGLFVMVIEPMEARKAS